MVIEKRFKAPYFKTAIQIFVYDDFDEAKVELPAFPDMADGYVQAFPCDNCVHIVIPHNKQWVVVHELEHAKNSIFKLIGHKSDVDNDEIDAYVIEWLWECAEKAIKKHRQTVENNRDRS